MDLCMLVSLSEISWKISVQSLFVEDLSLRFYKVLHVFWQKMFTKIFAQDLSSNPQQISLQEECARTFGTRSLCTIPYNVIAKSKFTRREMGTIKSKGML